ncbi:hypothetical protein GOP47_0010173 [Adiantum capillus-veneris]|uniref:Serine/threonine-protein kinase PRP4 homolog n=1 Tax=Adiantum capillus-veneris TaxID=13818 RepID=A0A9D4ZHI6_ADICA|nr:hypothetical protein GOP47_0010173 [Adiantum capillus-veneris]
MVRSPENFSIHERDSSDRKEEDVSKHHKHRVEEKEKHRSSESKSSKHKHKHHRHKHRRKHKKGNLEASADEVASDVGDGGSVDPAHGDDPKSELELTYSGVKHTCEDSGRVRDTLVIESEQAEVYREAGAVNETQQILECRLPGYASRHELDEEVEEGEILDEDIEFGGIQGGSLPPDSLLIHGLEQSDDDVMMKIKGDFPSEGVSAKESGSVKTDSKHGALSESRSMSMGADKEDSIKSESPRKESIEPEPIKELSLSPEKTGNSLSSQLSAERVPERSRCSRSKSRESEHYSRYSKDSCRRYERDTRAMSRDIASDSRYARSNHDRTERGQRSRSREVQHRSTFADDSWKWRESAYDRRDSRPRNEERRSRSRDRGRHEFVDRRRSASRSVRDYPDRRRSRSRGPYGEHIDRRRRSRSIESHRDRDKRRRSVSRSGRDNMNRKRSRSRGGYGEHTDKRRRSRSKESSRDQRVNEPLSYRSGRQSQGGYRVSGELRRKSEDQNLKEVDTTMREEEADFQDSASLHSEDEDVDKEVERIRLRRQAILEKHKKQEQLESMRNFDLNVELDASDSTLNAKLLVAENGSLVSDISKKAFNLDKGSLQNGLPDRPSGPRGLGEGTPKSEEKSNDVFNDYIFGDSPAGGRKQVKGDGLALETSGLTDNWDDAEGYYCHRIGEVLDGRYEIAASHGRGVFSSVVRARDLKASRKDVEEVAIKIIRNNDVMLKSGQQELSILRKLDGADPENRRHCVRFLTNFDYRKHLCLVFESMHMNLREVLKKFGRNIGLNLGAVRAYAKQLFIALKHLRNCGVLHCDIKPDNMLVNEAKNVLKLCDFGSAMFAGENEITPYLVSRFYRAPEIILGLPYDHPLDMWSVGCCLYEFFTGKVLFPGPTNNDMLRLHMELKGPFPKKMLKKAGFVSKHFDQDYNFCAVEEDPVTKASIKRVLVNVKPKDIASLVTGQGPADENGKMLNNFRDLLDKIFMLDPEKRLTVSQALSHPFITGQDVYKLFFVLLGGCFKDLIRFLLDAARYHSASFFSALGASMCKSS